MKGAIDVLNLKTGMTIRSLNLGPKGGIYADPVVFKSLDQTHLLIMNQSRQLVDYWLK